MLRERKLYNQFLLAVLIFTGALYLSSCNSSDIVSDIISNNITAKDRIDSANAQAEREYGSNTDMVLLYGKNVNTEGETNITALDILLNGNLDSIGTWLYVYKAQGDTTFRLYAPNPVPGARDCINLTQYFNIFSLLNLIQDTSAANIVRGALELIISSNIKITTPTNLLIDSDDAMNIANTEQQIIKFDSSFDPSISTTNGNVFFQTGSDKEINVFLLPAAGTLNLPTYIQELFGFPNDLWVVNYKKKNGNGETENLVLATIVQNGQTMGLNGYPGLSTRVINLSKFFNN